MAIKANPESSQGYLLPFDSKSWIVTRPMTEEAIHCEKDLGRCRGRFGGDIGGLFGDTIKELGHFSLGSISMGWEIEGGTGATDGGGALVPETPARYPPTA